MYLRKCSELLLQLSVSSDTSWSTFTVQSKKNLWSMGTRSVYCALKWRTKIRLVAANSNPCIDRTYRTVSHECLDYPSNAQAICTIFKYYVSIVTQLVRVLSACDSESRSIFRLINKFAYRMCIIQFLVYTFKTLTNNSLNNNSTSKISIDHFKSL